MILWILSSFVSLGTVNASPATSQQGPVVLSEANFPDPTFRAYISNLTGVAEGGTISEEKLLSVKTIDVSGSYNARGNIADLKGIEYFTSLNRLYCGYNQLTSLDVSNNTALSDLRCNGNQLTSLDVSNIDLGKLNCSNNLLTNLILSRYNHNRMTDLLCQDNQLTSLDLTNSTSLINLDCSGNQLTSLDVSNNTVLTTLYCFNNQLLSLDVSNNTSLASLVTKLEGSSQYPRLTAEIVGNNIYTIPVPPNFELSNVTGFTVNNEETSPTLVDGFLSFSSSTLPQKIIYLYSTGYSQDPNMLVNIAFLGIVDNSEVNIDGPGVILNETNFPDATFRAYISNLTGVEEGETVSEDKLFSVKSINVSGRSETIGSITDLKGIEYFTAINCLNCSYNQLTALDVSKNIVLTTLECNNNKLTNLDVSKNTSLTSLLCYMNQLVSLDVSKNASLTDLSCNNNQLTNLDMSNVTTLVKLNCSNNQLPSLDVSANTALISLDCGGNQLSSLDVSKNTSMTSLLCDRNQLNSLVVSNNTALTILNCYENQLPSLDVSANTALTELNCAGNKLPILDVSKNMLLTKFNSSTNQLTSLDVSNNTALTELLCTSNQLVSLDVSKNTALKLLTCGSNKLTTLDVSANTALSFLFCHDNKLTSLDVSKNTSLDWLICGYYEHTNLDVSKNLELTRLQCHHGLSIISNASNLYSISLPPNFDISKVSNFKVNNINVTPTMIGGTLVFSTSMIPQSITYKYEVVSYTRFKKMDVELTITSIEEPNYDNTIYMDDVEVLSGTEAVLSVKMKNEVVAEGFEFDMYLPEGITVVQDEDGFPEVTLSTERTTARKTNSFDAIFNADGSLRVLAASTNGSAISGNDGEVVQVKVAIADDMAEGDYTVCFKNIAISDENATSHTSAMTTSTIKVNTYIVGDANIDRKVDVADFTAVAHHLLNNTPQSFHMKAADANTDNRIDVGDLTAIAHLILYGTITKPTNTSGAKPFMMMDNGTPADENYIYIEPVSVQGRSEVTLSVKMRNAVEAEGFEFDLYLPDGMSFVTDTEGFAEVSLSTERTNSRKTNSFDSVIQEDGSLRVLAASTNGSSISGNDGEVALVTIHIDPNLAAAEYPLLLKNIAIADVNAVSHSTDLKESTITILGSGIVTDVEKVQSSKFKVQSDEWYSLDGKKLNSKPKTAGVYIKNGNKVVVK